MKKLSALIISSLLIFLCFTGCESKTETSGVKSDKLSIVTTIFPLYDFARQLVGNHADLTMLIDPGTEVHNYEPTASDLIKIQNCDIFIYIGGESDEWVNKILQSLDDDITVLKMFDSVELVEENENVDGTSSSETHEHDESNINNNSYLEYDEHIWTSPKNAISMFKSIADSIINIDKNNKDEFESNKKAYLEKLEELDNKFEEIVSNAKRKTIVFGDRFPFRYFADEYGLKYYAAFPGCSQESEPSPSTTASLVEIIKKENIPYIFYIEMSNEKMADTLCNETGAQKLLLHSCQTVTKDDFNSGKTFLDIMNQNAETIKTALN